MNPRYLRLSLLIFLVSVVLLPTQGNERLQFNRLSHIDGLLHDNVTSISQDSIGFIWFGTHRGLNRYDGYKIRSYKFEGDEINSVFYNRIYSIARQGNLLWLATEAGLSCFNTLSKEFINFDVHDKNSNEDFYKNVRNVYPDNAPDRVWLLSGNKMRLAEVEIGGEVPRLKVVKIGDSNCYEAEGMFPRVASDREGNVWFSGDSNIESYHRDKSGNLVYTGAVGGINGYNVRALLSENGTLWIAYDDKILRCDVQQDGMLRQKEEIFIPTGVGINSIASDVQNIWVAAQDGLFCLPKDDLKSFTTYRSSSSDMRSVIRDINNIFVDDFSNIWLSGWESGVAFANPMSGLFGTLRFPTSPNQNASEFISSLHAADDGYIYAGSKFGGIGRINADTHEPDWDFSRDAALMRNNIPSIADFGYQIFAAIGNSVVVVDKNTGKVIDRIPTKGEGYIFWITFDKFGSMWIATYSGLECFKQNENGKWINKYSFRADSPKPFTLTTDMLHNICSDIEKNELIVTSAMGINRVILNDKGDVMRILAYTASAGDHNHRLSSNYLWPIAKGNEPSTYWIGSMGSGLNKVKFIDNPDGTFSYTSSHYGREAGAVSDDIESIEIDKFGRVWCAGPGLGYFDENIGRFKFYFSSDGLQGNLFGTSSATTDGNGTLWFGGANGLNYFTPSRESFAPIRTEVVFSDVNAGGEQLSQSESASYLVLNYPDNHFTVDFTTLSFPTSHHVRYRYKLMGYDEDWNYIDPGEMPTVSYTRLPYKKMNLYVEAGDWRDWSGSPTILTIESKGPWWSSWWAVLIYLGIGVIVIIVFILLFVNRTRTKQAVAVRREKEEQQREMMQMKMRFFTDVSHEFRTPLTLIRHAAGELQHNSPDNDRYVRIIARNAGVLTNMVNELLDFHRADMKSTPLRTTLTTVHSMISAIVEEFRGWAEDSGIQIKLEFSEKDIEMWLDREQFSKVLSNVISNSIRYTDGKGLIEIKVSTGLYQDVTTAYPDRVALVSDMIPGKQLIIKIKDTGIGIPSAALPIIFERFKQTHGHSNTSSGSGIGLSLVKYLIELHHGGIVASSSEGNGTEIIIFIPMTYDYLTPEQKVGESAFNVKEYLNSYGSEYEKIVKTKPEEKSLKESENNPTIMVVDDNEEILDLLSDFFSKDYNVVLSKSAQDAIEKASKKLPDLIVSDIMMPGIDGIEFCSKLKNDLRTCHIPVVLLTAMAHEENQIEGIETGADAYIAKPFNPRLLTATVKNLLARNHREKTNESTIGKPEVSVSRQEIIDKKELELFKKFETLVRQNFTNYDYKVDNIWKDLNINRTKLYNLVKDVTGISLGNYIRKLRLEKAAELLLTTDMNIAEVAFNVGIDSHAYFTRSFRQEFGMSPTEWIKSHKK